MDDRERGERTEDASRVLSRLVEVHKGLAAIQSERRRLVADVQGRRGDARHSVMRVEDQRRRLVVRRSRAVEADEKLESLAAAVENEKAAHEREVAEYGAALRAAAEARTKLRREAQELEKRRADLARALPRIYARAYAALLAQGIADPIVDVSGGVCSCGHALDRSREVFPTSCEDCERLLILSEGAGSTASGPAE